MKKLIPLSNDPSYIKRYEKIRAAKQISVQLQLSNSHNFINERYNLLNLAIETHSLHLMAKDGRTAPIVDALLSCYKNKTQPLQDLKDEIKKAQPIAQLKYCPMCGTTLPTTFDHYLPTLSFPEFSVHALNLVPSCSLCNSTKTAHWINTNEQRQYLHVFSDEIPDIDFLEVELLESGCLTGVGAAFSLKKPDEINSDMWALIKSHFLKLNLLERYTELSNDEIGCILIACKSYADLCGSEPSLFLRSYAQKQSMIYGRNHWRVPLMEAMACHTNLERWIK